MGLSFVFPDFEVKENLANTLYTITGIMFSIGLSLTVISSTVGIVNKDILRRIRKQIKHVRDSFIGVFIIASITFILYICTPDLQIKWLNKGWSLLLVQLISILFFIINFINIQKFNEDIEDNVNGKT